MGLAKHTGSNIPEGCPSATYALLHWSWADLILSLNSGQKSREDVDVSTEFLLFFCASVGLMLTAGEKKTNKQHDLGFYVIISHTS